ncbi:hypothetical protein BB560_004513 [Smittium megazygosporum]|uniref:Uncharacterized protein n=1 Tax=Smittium megazygosporum TaxID=133381 RepID=A0A2T9Z916_9FUNG|nr:hypothetical protein BB560_004513 [Smittium megazygosporum]
MIENNSQDNKSSEAEIQRKQKCLSLVNSHKKINTTPIDTTSGSGIDFSFLGNLDNFKGESGNNKTAKNFNVSCKDINTHIKIENQYDSHKNENKKVVEDDKILDISDISNANKLNNKLEECTNSENIREMQIRFKQEISSYRSIISLQKKQISKIKKAFKKINSKLVKLQSGNVFKPKITDNAKNRVEINKTKVLHKSDKEVNSKPVKIKTINEKSCSGFSEFKSRLLSKDDKEENKKRISGSGFKLENYLLETTKGYIAEILVILFYISEAKFFRNGFDLESYEYHGPSTFAKKVSGYRNYESSSSANLQRKGSKTSVNSKEIKIEKGHYEKAAYEILEEFDQGYMVPLLDTAKAYEFSPENLFLSKMVKNNLSDASINAKRPIFSDIEYNENGMVQKALKSRQQNVLMFLKDKNIVHICRLFKNLVSRLFSSGLLSCTNEVLFGVKLHKPSQSVSQIFDKPFEIKQIESKNNPLNVSKIFSGFQIMNFDSVSNLGNIENSFDLNETDKPSSEINIEKDKNKRIDNLNSNHIYPYKAQELKTERVSESDRIGEPEPIIFPLRKTSNNIDARLSKIYRSRSEQPSIPPSKRLNYAKALVEPNTIQDEESRTLLVKIKNMVQIKREQPIGIIETSSEAQDKSEPSIQNVNTDEKKLKINSKNISKDDSEFINKNAGEFSEKEDANLPMNKCLPNFNSLNSTNLNNEANQPGIHENASLEIGKKSLGLTQSNSNLKYSSVVKLTHEYETLNDKNLTSTPPFMLKSTSDEKNLTGTLDEDKPLYKKVEVVDQNAFSKSDTDSLHSSVLISSSQSSQQSTYPQNKPGVDTSNKSMLLSPVQTSLDPKLASLNPSVSPKEPRNILPLVIRPLKPKSSGPSSVYSSSIFSNSNSNSNRYPLLFPQTPTNTSINTQSISLSSLSNNSCNGIRMHPLSLANKKTHHFKLVRYDYERTRRMATQFDIDAPAF